MGAAKGRTAGDVDLSWLEWLAAAPVEGADPRVRDAMSFITWLLDQTPDDADAAPPPPPATTPATAPAPAPWPERRGPRPGRPTRTQRRDATEYALARLLGGRTLADVADELRLAPKTLLQWILLALSHPRCALRARPDGRVSLDLPSGTCLHLDSLDALLALEARAVFARGKAATRLAAALGDQLRALRGRMTGPSA